MKISYYSHPEIQEGTQPVRVLNPLIKNWFISTYPNFSTIELEDAIKRLGLTKDINFIFGDLPIPPSPAHIVYNTICISETFISYLWCFSYALWVILDEQIIRPRITPNYVFSEEISTLIKEAHAVKDYGLSLMLAFSTWNLEIPNPEYYDQEANTHIGKANGVFLHAVSFVLLHELGHIILEADDDISSKKDVKTKEYEADAYALNTMSKGNLTKATTLQAGIISGLSSLIFFSANMLGGSHPDPDERLKIAFEKMQIPEDHNFWAAGCLAINLWSAHFKAQLKWPGDNEMETYKEVFYHLLSELSIYKVLE